MAAGTRPLNARGASMDEAERKAAREASRILNQFLRKQLAFDEGPEGPEHGRGRRRHHYHYFESPDQRMFCWTPWKDQNGNYWTWVMKPVGRGSRSGKAKFWKRVGKRVRSRTRKTAKKRAHTRYIRWMNYLAENAKRKAEYDEWVKSTGR
jgi:hypothetical protein